MNKVYYEGKVYDVPKLSKELYELLFETGYELRHRKRNMKKGMKYDERLSYGRLLKTNGFTNNIQKGGDLAWSIQRTRTIRQILKEEPVQMYKLRARAKLAIKKINIDKMKDFYLSTSTFHTSFSAILVSNKIINLPILCSGRMNVLIVFHPSDYTHLPIRNLSLTSIPIRSGVMSNELFSVDVVTFLVAISLHFLNRWRNERSTFSFLL